MIRVMIVAASPLARAGLGNLLTARDVEVVASGGSIEALTELLSNAAPDVVLIDASGESIEPRLASIVASGLPSDLGVLILADSIPPAALSDALREGIRGVLPADILPDQLAAALRAVASGLLVVHPANAAEALPVGSAPPPAIEEMGESLTRREIEVLQMLAGGLSNKAIGARLNISEHTVKFHVASILGKLGAASRTEAVALAIRRGLVLV